MSTKRVPKLGIITMAILLLVGVGIGGLDWMTSYAAEDTAAAQKAATETAQQAKDGQDQTKDSKDQTQAADKTSEKAIDPASKDAKSATKADAKSGKSQDKTSKTEVTSEAAKATASDDKSKDADKTADQPALKQREIKAKLIRQPLYKDADQTTEKKQKTAELKRVTSLWEALMDRKLPANEDSCDLTVTVSGKLPEGITAQAHYIALEDASTHTEQGIASLDLTLFDKSGKRYIPDTPVTIAVKGDVLAEQISAAHPLIVYSYAANQARADQYTEQYAKDDAPIYAADVTVARSGKAADKLLRYETYDPDKTYKKGADAVRFTEGKDKLKTETDTIRFAYDFAAAAEAAKKAVADGKPAAGASDAHLLLTAQMTTRTLRAKAGDAKITVSGALDPDVTLKVREVGEKDKNYDTYVAKTAKALDAEGSGLDFVRAFDIKLVAPETGKEFEPDSDMKVSIQLGEEDLDEDADFNVAHFADGAGKAPELVDAKRSGDTVKFTAEGFSVYVVAYTVDFHWGDYSYSINGEDSVLLSKLFKELGVDEITISDVKNVTFSDPKLVKVTKKGDDWLLTSQKAFRTDETLTLELKNGEKVEIGVTDDVVAQLILYNNSSQNINFSWLMTGKITIDGRLVYNMSENEYSLSGTNDNCLGVGEMITISIPNGSGRKYSITEMNVASSGLKVQQSDGNPVIIDEDTSKPNGSRWGFHIDGTLQSGRTVVLFGEGTIEDVINGIDSGSSAGSSESGSNSGNKVIYDYNYPSGVSGQPQNYIDENVKFGWWEEYRIKIQDPTPLDGYAFAGWKYEYNENNVLKIQTGTYGNSIHLHEDPNTKNGSVTITAEWTPALRVAAYTYNYGGVENATLCDGTSGSYGVSGTEQFSTVGGNNDFRYKYAEKNASVKSLNSADNYGNGNPVYRFAAIDGIKVTAVKYDNNTRTWQYTVDNSNWWDIGNSTLGLYYIDATLKIETKTFDVGDFENAQTVYVNNSYLPGNGDQSAQSNVPHIDDWNKLNGYQYWTASLKSGNNVIWDVYSINRDGTYKKVGDSTSYEIPAGAVLTRYYYKSTVSIPVYWVYEDDKGLHYIPDNDLETYSKINIRSYDLTTDYRDFNHDFHTNSDYQYMGYWHKSNSNEEPPEEYSYHVKDNWWYAKYKYSGTLIGPDHAASTSVLKSIADENDSLNLRVASDGSGVEYRGGSTGIEYPLAVYYVYQGGGQINKSINLTVYSQWFDEENNNYTVPSNASADYIVHRVKKENGDWKDDAEGNTTFTLSSTELSKTISGLITKDEDGEYGYWIEELKSLTSPTPSEYSRVIYENNGTATNPITTSKTVTVTNTKPSNKITLKISQSWYDETTKSASVPDGAEANFSIQRMKKNADGSWSKKELYPIDNEGVSFTLYGNGNESIKVPRTSEDGTEEFGYYIIQNTYKPAVYSKVEENNNGSEGVPLTESTDVTFKNIKTKQFVITKAWLDSAGNRIDDDDSRIQGKEIQFDLYAVKNPTKGVTYGTNLTTPPADLILPDGETPEKYVKLAEGVKNNDTANPTKFDFIASETKYQFFKIDGVGWYFILKDKLNMNITEVPDYLSRGNAQDVTRFTGRVLEWQKDFSFANKGSNTGQFEIIQDNRDLTNLQMGDILVYNDNYWIVQTTSHLPNTPGNGPYNSEHGIYGDLLLLGGASSASGNTEKNLIISYDDQDKAVKELERLTNQENQFEVHRYNDEDKPYKLNANSVYDGKSWSRTVNGLDPAYTYYAVEVAVDGVRLENDANVKYTYNQGEQTLTIKNVFNVEGSRKVILRKVDGKFAPKEGETFNICSVGSNTPIDNTKKDLKSNDSGIIWVGELPYGKYDIVETSQGDRTFTIDVSETGVKREYNTNTGREREVLPNN